MGIGTFMMRVLLVLVRLLPAPFRAEFGAELREHIARDYAAARRRHFAAAIGVSLATALDLLWCAVAERVRPTVVSHYEPFDREDGMQRLGNGLRGDLR
ncbi:MAG: hypothetical protein ACRENC_13420, partial [Gemmatimonadaceae bacterium]